MKNLYFALGYNVYDEEINILGSFYGTDEKADSYFITTFGNEYIGMSGDCEIVQTREDARKVIMDQTDMARNLYNTLADSDKKNFDGRIAYYNMFLMKAIPEYIRKLAV